MSLPRCDCLNYCGDHIAVERGTVQPCDLYVRWLARPRILAVSRVADDPLTLAVHFSTEPTDKDLLALQRLERWPSP